MAARAAQKAASSRRSSRPQWSRPKAKQGAQAALSALNPTDQYLLLVGLLADLHAKFGGEVPRSTPVEVPRSERKPTGISQPPPAVRPGGRGRRSRRAEAAGNSASQGRSAQGNRRQVSLARVGAFRHGGRARREEAAQRHA